MFTFLWIGIAALVAYELLRWRILTILRRRWQRSIGQFLRRHGVALEHFRFIDRLWVRQTLLQDPELDTFATEHAVATGKSLGEVRVEMEEYLDEIVPYFNLFSYYKLGAGVARAATRLCYELWFDGTSLASAREQVPPGAVVVFVANHRSNADYVVLSVGALRQVAMSYAVGEWALVRPLDVLFRSFGSYFVRRGEKDPLYHAVLERYLQLVASRGLTTAFFLEGGLTRDGAFRTPKVGLLDYLVGMLRSEPDREIVFIPVGINYDRALEDRNLLTFDRPPRAFDKVRSLVGIVARFPWVFGAFFVRAALRSHRKFGYAAVAFGPPIPIGAVLEDPGRTARLPKEMRRNHIAAAADALLDRVAAVVPATPVVLLTRALRSGAADRAELRRRVREEIAGCRAAGRPLAFGLAYAEVEMARARNLDEARGDKTALDQELIEGEEAERTVDLALSILKRRGLVAITGPMVGPAPGADALLAWYARSLDAPLHRAARQAPSDPSPPRLSEPAPPPPLAQT